MAKFLAGLIVGTCLLFAIENVVSDLDRTLCPDRITKSTTWEGYLSTKNGITYCFEKATTWPNKTIYRGIVKVDK